MAIGVLILGESGTGKTFSIKGFDPDEVKIISVTKPILPFRGKYDITKAPTGDEVVKAMHDTDKKNIVVDDLQYILGIPMMDRISEKGWEKFNEIQVPYNQVLNEIQNLPDDVIVFFTSHTETDENGKRKIKTIGKALDKYITIEGLFMIVLGTFVCDGKYYFQTQNSGNDTLKSPEGLFPTKLIQNDLKYVAEKIRNYYYMEGAISDSEAEKADEAHAVTEDLTEKKKRRRKPTEEQPHSKYYVTDKGHYDIAEPGEDIPEGAHEISKEQYDEQSGFMDIPEGSPELVPLTEPEEETEKPTRRRRKKS